ncbi:MAG: DUF4386 domain-containing protein [Bacteroidota bacterium]
MNSYKTSNLTAGISIGKAAVIAGIALLLMAIIAPIANFAILNKIYIPGDAVTTFGNLLASQEIFRLGIGIFILVAVLDIIVAWALYVFLKPVNSSLSLLAAWFRIVYAAMLAVVFYYLINVLQLAGGADYLSAYTQEQLQAQVMINFQNFTICWQFALIIFGFHLLVLGYLFLKAGYMKQILGILVMLASVGYLLDGFGKLLSVNYNISISAFTFIGEVVVIFWLLIKGRQVKEVQ